MLAVGRPQAKAGGGRFIAIFQPHRYTRLRQFWHEFMESLRGADEIIVTDVYEASEPPLEGVSGPDFARVLAEQYPEESVRYVAHADWEQLKEMLQNSVEPGDVVMSIGAGDITYLLRDWSLSAESADSAQSVSEKCLS